MYYYVFVCKSVCVNAHVKNDIIDKSTASASMSHDESQQPIQARGKANSVRVCVCRQYERRMK